MRIFFVEAETQYSIDLAGKMVDAGHTISHVTAHFYLRSKGDLQNARPYVGATILNSRDFYRHKTLRELYAHLFIRLDAGIINFFEPIERDAYIISDRWNYTPINFRARKLHFRDLIRFWLGYLKRENVEAVYFPCTPHTVWELVLLHACKYLGIPACYLSHTAINNRSLLRDCYGPLPPVPRHYLEGRNADAIFQMLPRDLLQDYEEDSVVTNVIKAQNDFFNHQKNLNSGTIMLPPKRVGTNSFFSSKVKPALAIAYHMAQPWKRLFIRQMAMDKHSNMLMWQYARLRHRYSAKQLKKFYEDHSLKVDLNQNYVYFPLHLQPELTTQPEAQMFEDQLLALETIVKAAPDNWDIYVKENPRQYDATLNEGTGRSFRTIDDMRDILAISSKIKLVPQNIKSADLIANAKAIVVLTGTAGWESLISGKPCITLAHPWYSPCNSCIKVQSPHEMYEAFNEIQKISNEDVRRDLACYLHYYAEQLIVATLSDDANVDFNTRPVSELLERHSLALDRWLKDRFVLHPDLIPSVEH